LLVNSNQSLNAPRLLRLLEATTQAHAQNAARRLRLTEDGILDIILDCGIVNPSHFYKLFKKRFGMTPRHYRSARWT